MIRIYTHQTSAGHHVSTHTSGDHNLFSAFRPDSEFYKEWWTTARFVRDLMSLPNAAAHFEICAWHGAIPMAHQGIYLLHYGNAQSLADNIGFITMPAVVRDQINDGVLTLLVALVYETLDSMSLQDWQGKFCTFLNELGITRARSVKVLFSGQSQHVHLHVDPRVSWLWYPWFEISMQNEARNHYKSPDQIAWYDATRPKTHKYLSLNRRARAHRILMLAMLSHINLSYLGLITWPANHQRLLDVHTYRSYTNGLKRLPLLETYIRENRNLTDGYVDSTADMSQWWLSVNHMYDQADFEIINETYHCNIGDMVWLTEKTFRSLAFGIPFVLIGVPGCLALLHQLGYQTFDTVFDERYDLEQAPMHRLQLVTEEVKKLCLLDANLPNPYLQSQVLHTIKHNRTIFWSKNHAMELWSVLSHS